MSDLRSELLAIREGNGELTPAAVVAAATPEDHPLHSQFEWDDTVAGRKYRIIQARELIRVVKETYIDGQGNPEKTRFFVSVSRPTGMAYEPAGEVVQDEFASKLVLQSMEREWRQLKRRYERFSQFRDMILGDMTEAV